jgi:anti-sigma factor RsiW
MNCREGVGQLMEYTEGMLPQTQRSVLEAHVRGCTRCARFVASYRATVRLMRQATKAAIPVALQRRLRLLIAQQPARAGQPRGRRSR